MEEKCGVEGVNLGGGRVRERNSGLREQNEGAGVRKKEKGRKRDARENMMRRSKKESTHLDGVTNEAADDMTIPSCNIILLPLPSSCSL